MMLKNKNATLKIEDMISPRYGSTEYFTKSICLKTSVVEMDAQLIMYAS